VILTVPEFVPDKALNEKGLVGPEIMADMGETQTILKKRQVKKDKKIFFTFIF